MELLTNSRSAAFQACPKMHEFLYEIARRSIRIAPELQFGTDIHLGLETWLPNRDMEAALDIAWKVWGERQNADPFDWVRISETIKAYHDRWKDSEFEFVAAEIEFRAPLAHPVTGEIHSTFELGGKIDGILKDKKGKFWLLEHKTHKGAVQPGSDYFLNLQTDPQISTYYCGAHFLGYDIVGCVYDVIGKPVNFLPKKTTPFDKRKYTKGKKCKPCKGSGFLIKKDCPPCNGTGWEEEPRLYANCRETDETPDDFRFRFNEKIRDNDLRDYFYRENVYRMGDEIHQHRLDMWDLADDIARKQHSGYWRSNKNNCRNKYFRMCDYHAVCRNNASIDDDLLFRSTRQHEELDSPNEGQKESENVRANRSAGTDTNGNQPGGQGKAKRSVEGVVLRPRGGWQN